MFEIIGFLVVYIILLVLTVLLLVDYARMIDWPHMRQHLIITIPITLIIMCGWWWFFNYF